MRLLSGGRAGVCVSVCVCARVHTQGADSLLLGDFGQGWCYLVEVGVSEKELNS